MKHIRLKHIPFKIKLFLIVGSIFLTLALLVCLLFSKTSIQNAIINDKTSSEVILERISTQINSLYEQMNIAATSITKNPTLKTIVLGLNTNEAGSDGKYFHQLQQERTIQTALGNMMFSPVISNVLLYNQDRNYFYYSGIYYNDMDYVYAQLEATDTPKQFKAVPVLYEPPHQNPWTTDQRQILSVLRNFSDAATTHDTIVEIQVSCRLLDDICTQDTFQSEKEILILDSSGSIVYPYDTGITTLPEGPVGQIVIGIASGKDCRYSYGYSYHALKSDSTQFTTVLISNNRSLKRQIVTYLIVTVLAALLTLAVSLLIFFTLLTQMTKPLNQLIAHANELSLDSDTRLVLPGGTLDEFEILSASMNQMVTKLKASIQEIYELQLRESSANLAALQAQVDPHFLYNALNSISAASEVYDSGVTTEMCQQLSSMLRYVTSRKKEVPLIEELTHTRNYLEFMKISNDSNFDYQIEVPASLHSLLLPKLSIQPFAENSFRHGFKNTLPPWHLSIACHHTEKIFEITIRDNGSGFSPKALSSISSGAVSANELEINGLGLNNTFSRLSLYFGPSFSFHVENLSQGCLITLKGTVKHD